MQTKVCTNCGRELPLAEFYKRADSKDGRRSHCKRCRAEYNAKYDASPKRKASRAKYDASLKGKATRAKADVKYAASPKGKASRAKIDAKRRASPKGKATTARHNAKRRSAYDITPRLTAADWRNILELYDNRCAYCGAEGDLQQDHIIPIARGGKHEAANVAPSCRRCNSFKRVKLPADLPARYRAAIRRHAELLGAADIPIIEQERLYAQF